MPKAIVKGKVVAVPAKIKYLSYWAEYQLTNPKLVFNMRYNTYTSDTLKIQSNKDLIIYLNIKAVEQGFPSSGVKSILGMAIERQCMLKGIEYKESFVKTLCSSDITPEQAKKGDLNLRNLINYMTGRLEQLDLIVMKQFLWTIKRNLCGLPVKHRMMPIWYGAQDTGKTTIALRLLSPLEGLVAKDKCSIFSDGTKLKALSKLAAIILDEMQDIKKTGKEHLKSIISDGVHLQREFYSQDNFSYITVTAAFIGLTNEPVSESIKDDEMRRFWQMEMASYAWINQFWDAHIETMDWRSIWDCVNQNQPEPIDHVWHEVKASQVMLSTKDTVGDFIDEELVLCDNENTAHEAYNIYMQWARRKNNRRPLTFNKFLVQFKTKVSTKKTPSGVKYLFREKEEILDGTHELPVDPDTYYDPMDGPSDHEGAECEFD